MLDMVSLFCLPVFLMRQAKLKTCPTYWGLLQNYVWTFAKCSKKTTTKKKTKGKNTNEALFSYYPQPVYTSDWIMQEKSNISISELFYQIKEDLQFYFCSCFDILLSTWMASLFKVCLLSFRVRFLHWHKSQGSASNAELASACG